MIDLHMHTTASDGALAPPDLVARAAGVGIRTMAVTDHDTMAGVEAAAAAAGARGLAFLPGIEITAVDGRRDVHVLAYFLHHEPPGLGRFLRAAREDRARRARDMAEKLAALGMPIEIDDLIRTAEESGRAVARPNVARALIDAGHVRSLQEAFDRYLADGGPAYVARIGAPPAEVVRLVATAGGVSSLAHPGLLRKDHLIPELAAAGLDALEVFHSEHDSADQARYLRLAERHGLTVSGGSDFHGDDHHRAGCFGRVGLPAERFAALRQRLQQAHAAVHGPASRATDARKLPAPDEQVPSEPTVPGTMA